MTLTIDLSPDEEARLQAAARSQGLDPVEYLKRILDASLSPARPGAATQALFDQWDAEDATEDLAETAARNQEWEELKEALNKTRSTSGEEKLFP